MIHRSHATKSRTRAGRAILAASALAATLVPLGMGAAGASSERHDVVHFGSLTGSASCTPRSEWTVVEAAGSVAEPTVCRWQHGTGTGKVDYATQAGTATPGNDYTHEAGTLELNPIDNREIRVPILHDEQQESVQTFEVDLSNARDARGMILSFPSTATVSIIDDDGTSRVSFSDAEYSNYENRDSVVLRVVRSGDDDVSHSVTVATSNGTAHAGDDYTTVSKLVTFAPSDRVKRVEVPLKDDFTGEPTEHFNATLTGPGLAEPDSARVDILDDDSASSDIWPPVTRFHMPRHGKTYDRSGPMGQEVHISPSDNASGIDKVFFALRKKLRNGDCLWYNGNRFRRRSCTNKRWIGVREDTFIIYQFDRRLKPTTRKTGIRNYRAYTYSVDNAGNVEHRFVVGRNKNTYEIRPG